MRGMRVMALLGVAGGVGVASFAWAQVTYTVVAKTGDVAPGTGGRIFDSFGSPAINNQGRVVLFGDLTGATASDEGVWTNGGGALELLVREGDAAPSLAGLTLSFADAGAGYIDDSGRAATVTDLVGTGVTSSNDICLWVRRDAPLQVLARQGQIAPGTGPGIVYGGAEGILNVRFGRTGLVAFSSQLSGAGISTANDRAIYSEALGTLTLVGREGNPAPGLGTGVTYLAITPDGSPIGDAGEMAFSSTVAGTGVTGLNDEVVWYASSAGTQVLLREGSSVPGLGEGVTFTDLGAPGMSRTGLAAVTGEFAGPGVTGASDRAIWVGVPGSVRLAVREGQAAPELSVGATFSVLPLTAHSVNSAGQVAFVATLVGTDVTTATNITVWSEGGGTLRLVAREGFSAPELPPGVIFTDAFSQPLINDEGQVCFTATISGPGVVSANNGTLWATDSLGALVLVMREGVTQIDLNPDPGVEDLRTVEAFSFLDVPGWNGFNDRGEVALDVTFTDNSDAIVVAALPVITQCPNCPADFDEDGGVTGADISAFFAEFEVGGACADADQDGGITGADIAVFFVAYEAGGC